MISYLLNPLVLFSVFFSLVVLVAPVVIYLVFQGESRKSWIVTYQTLCELGAVLVVGWYWFSSKDPTKNLIFLPVLLGLICFFIAEFGFNTTFFEKSFQVYRDRYFCAISYTLTFGFLAASLIFHFKIYQQSVFVFLGVLAVALVHFAFQYRYLIIPLQGVYFSKLPYFMYVNGVLYSVLTALVAGIAFTYCLRSSDLVEFIFLHLLVALLTFDFAARYQIVQSEFDQMTMAQYFWAITVGAIFITIFISLLHGEMIFSRPGLLSSWVSIRASLALLIFAITVLIILALLILRFFSVQNAIDVTLVLTIILICWTISNWVAFNVSSKFMEISFLMGTNRVSDVGTDGSPGILLKKIEKKIPFSSEMNLIIDQYNQTAEKFNLRGQRLIESIANQIKIEKDALRGQIAKQIAHDIASPLGAMRTMIGLPQLNTDRARETLWTALNSISDMVNRLNFRPEETVQTEMKVYSTVGALEKIINLKKAEFSELEIDLSLSISKNTMDSFILISLDAFRSIVSNLVNNSKDEILRKGSFGKVAIELDQVDQMTLVSISDNGAFISEKRLSQLNSGDYESTKHRSKPLGIASSREILKRFGGSLSFLRLEPVGLKAVIRLPSYGTPEWLVSEICLNEGKSIVVLDDDESIHQLLKIRLVSDPKLAQLPYFSFKTEKSLSQFLEGQKKLNHLFLVDYELRGNSKTGIQVIDTLKLNQDSVLMTSHWDESSILKACRASKIRLLPKTLAHNIPIKFGKINPLDFILVDDHPIVRFAWKSAAESYGLKYRIFSDPVYFEMHRRDFEKTKLFLDFHFPETNASELLMALNGEFPDYYILTGEEKGNLDKFTGIDPSRIIWGKTFPSHFFC